MIIFRDAAALEARRLVAAGALRPLADSLAADLAPWVATLPKVDVRKARLTRRGGRCPADQTVLAFDPASPHRHRCPRCARWWTGADHDDYWVYGYHLWLAERATHAALLFALRGDPAHQALATHLLDDMTGQYARWPNRDNVLGPSRPFFSTYLESLWLLQLASALDLLEVAHGAAPALARDVRTHLLGPSRDLIASYPEGASNRQAWNASAVAAAALLLGERARAEEALTGASGISGLLAGGLLEDGSWYEGENYHQFAWRGLWFGVHIAEVAGIRIAPDLLARFDRGAHALVRTALPDLTLPARRDSPHRTSLRQWRYAEMLELALVRQPDDRALSGALARLYAPDLVSAETSRARSTGEAERNEPPARLTRASLGWKSLAVALAELPANEPDAPASVLLPAQGLAIIRREGGNAYVALDYGETGGGHGHPDRLNLLLMQGATRWLDDMGTGSYTTDDLFWYRSSLAHNAPLVDGRMQRASTGTLRAFADDGQVGWMSGSADALAPGVSMTRTVVVMDGYLVDELRWSAHLPVAVELPMHVDGTFGPVLPWEPTVFALPPDADDGFKWLSRVEAAPWPTRTAPVFHAVRGTAHATVRLLLPEGASVWRADAPAAPGEGTRRFHVVRAHGRDGVIVAVWDWAGDRVQDAARVGRALSVSLHAQERHLHVGDERGWHVDVQAGGTHRQIDLAVRAHEPSRTNQALAAAPSVRFDPSTTAAPEIEVAPDRPLRLEFGEPHWRWTEDDWLAAGRPTATVTLSTRPGALHIAVQVVKRHPTFASPCDENPLDNEHPDINSDGVQLHLAVPGAGEARWIVVPDLHGGARVTARTPLAETVPLEVVTRYSEDGWEAELVLPTDGPVGRRFLLDLLVNEIAPGRARRRGQLVLSGAHGQRAYLVGDRHQLVHSPVLTIVDA